MVHVKGFMIKQNIQPRIMSLVLLNHSKSNVLCSKIQNWIIKKDSKNLESGCPPGSLFLTRRNGLPPA
jgi:hypothetical protein